MGNHKFRLSDMIPNAWFYKLKGMGKKSGRNHKNNTTTKSCKKKHQNQPTSSSSLSSSSYSSTSASAKTTTTHRKSYYFTRELNCPPPPHHISPEPPRKSSKKRRSTAKRSGRTAATGCRSCRASMESVWTKPDSTPEEYPDSPLDSTSDSSDQESLLPGLLPSAATPETFDGMLKFHTVSKFDLPPIITKPNNNLVVSSSGKEFESLKHENEVKNLNLSLRESDKYLAELIPPRTRGIPEVHPKNQACKFSSKHGYKSLSVKIVKNADNIVPTSREQRTCSVRRFSGNSPGLKLRTNSPRIGNRRIQRRSTSIVGKSFAVVKSSDDPQKDFRESMVEMIVENNIRASKDLENLLACYLSLNSNEYHDLIIKVFKQIWFDITDVRLK